MSSVYLSLFLDVLVLVFLGVTILYVFRLSKALAGFKQHRREFDSVITNLLSSIDQAERSVQTLKTISAQESGHLENLIEQSKALSEELRIINDAGESMASRLEKLAEKNSKIAQQSNSYAAPVASGRKRHAKERKISSPVPRSETIEDVRDVRQEKQSSRDDSYAQSLRSVSESREDIPSFMIQDRDHDDVSTNDKYDPTAQNDDTTEEFKSQAERELLDALRKSKQNISRGGQS